MLECIDFLLTSYNISILSKIVTKNLLFITCYLFKHSSMFHPIDSLEGYHTCIVKYVETCWFK